MIDKMRHKVYLLIIGSILLVLLYGCGNRQSEQTEYIGIIAAMDNEIDLLLSEMKIDHTDTMGGVDYYVGTILNNPVVVSKGGIGKVRASSALTTMLNQYPISCVLFTGIAGGIAEETQVLDVVIGNRLVESDYGVIRDSGFVWASGDSGESIHPGEYYYSNPVLVDLAYETAVQVLGEEHVFKGTIATGDQYVASEEEVKKLRAAFDAYACEMEGAAIAVVCNRFDTPFVVIRALSDKADGKSHESYEGFADSAAANSNQILLKMLENIDY